MTQRMGWNCGLNPSIQFIIIIPAKRWMARFVVNDGRDLLSILILRPLWVGRATTSALFRFTARPRRLASVAAAYLIVPQNAKTWWCRLKRTNAQGKGHAESTDLFRIGLTESPRLNVNWRDPDYIEHKKVRVRQFLKSYRILTKKNPKRNIDFEVNIKYSRAKSFSFVGFPASSPVKYIHE